MPGEQLTLDEGVRRRDAGMFAADVVADEDWRARTDAAIAELAESGEPFTSEDVRERAGDPPSHPNAMGARFMAAARRGLICRIGYRKARRATLHAHHLGLWQGTGAAA